MRKIRNPKSEIRKKAEARNPKRNCGADSPSAFGYWIVAHRQVFGFRISDFGFHFGVTPCDPRGYFTQVGQAAFDSVSTRTFQLAFSAATLCRSHLSRAAAAAAGSSGLGGGGGGTWLGY